MGEPVEFAKFPKIQRYNDRFSTIIITEKIDGTNAQVYIPEDPAQPVQAGSRNRWISPGKGTDNYDFAAFVEQHAEQLRAVLGPGRHYGEWWGAGIGPRKYAMTSRRWSLFDPLRWVKGTDGLVRIHVREGEDPDQIRPALPAEVDVVPLLYRGVFTDAAVQTTIDMLKAGGSWAAPGYMNPEGIVLKHLPSGMLVKWTYDYKKGPSPEEGVSAADALDS